MAIDLARRRMASRSFADGPTQVRCDLRSLASGEPAGRSQVSPLASWLVTLCSGESSVRVIPPPSVPP
jgi:hypothetical protein